MFWQYSFVAKPTYFYFSPLLRKAVVYIYWFSYVPNWAAAPRTLSGDTRKMWVSVQNLALLQFEWLQRAETRRKKLISAKVKWQLLIFLVLGWHFGFRLTDICSVHQLNLSYTLTHWCCFSHDCADFLCSWRLSPLTFLHFGKASTSPCWVFSHPRGTKSKSTGGGNPRQRRINISSRVKVVTKLKQKNKKFSARRSSQSPSGRRRCLETAIVLWGNAIF